MKNQEGFVFEVLVGLFVLVIIAAVIALPFVKFEASEQVVSGIVYNNRNNAFFSGNTNFSVRASEDTYINETNQSSYCLPPGSPYIELVNKAAADKNIKVIVTTSKMFRLAAPWTCIDNVTVEVAKSDTADE